MPTLTFLGAARTVTGSKYLLETGEARILVDCGLYQERKLKDRNWEPFCVPPGSIDTVLLTHAHVDHCSAADTLRQQLGVPIEGPHLGDAFWFEKLPEWCRMAGMPPAEPFAPDRWLVDGDTVTVGDLRFDVLHCPGHTPGHVVF